jgi:dihydrofolate synthase/folylpolyglutamate synthase
MTSLAFWYFAKEEVDIAVIETGLGGRLDATNVVSPICTAITSISLDHTDLLGDTIEQIAKEKGGICKSGVPLVIGQLPQKAQKELEIIAYKNHSKLIVSQDLIGKDHSENIISKWMQSLILQSILPLTDVEKLNLPIVAGCLSQIQSNFPDQITEKGILNGIINREKLFPLRATFVRLTDTKRWYYDGAHNIESLEFLFIQLKKIAPLSEWTLVCGFMKDKLRPEITPLLSQIESRYFIPIHSLRAVSYSEFIDWWNSSLSGSSDKVSNMKSHDKSELATIPSPPLLIEDFEEAKRRFSDELVIFTGSFYFYEALMMSE